MYLKQLLCNKNIKHKELAKILNTDKSVVSKIMNYKVLPIPEDAQKICNYLNCNILDLYELKEIVLKNIACKSNNKEVDKKYYRLSVRLKLGGCNLLQQPKKLNELGYESIADWVRKKILELEEEYKRYKKQKRLNGKFKQPASLNHKSTLRT